MKKQSREEQRFYRELGANLRGLRESYGLSQSELARQIGERPNAVNRWEAGRYRPTIIDIWKLAQRFGITRLAFILPELPEVKR